MLKTLIAKNKNSEIRELSRSGGVFTVLSDAVLKQNGVVYGCVLNDNFEAVHLRADTFETRDLMRGSKYVQSDLKDCFNQVKEDLIANKYVLFSGTACQVDGLRAFLGKEYDKLLLVDIVCHGVSSPKVWSDYLEWQKQKHHGKISRVDFSDKKRFGWKDHRETLKINDKYYSSTVFTELFYQHCILRPACSKCPYKSIERPGDITIGDAWGISEANSEFDDNKGVSLVLVDNVKGSKFAELIYEKCDALEVDIKNYMQTALVNPYEMPENRTEFWTKYKSQSFQKIAQKYTEEALPRKIRKILSYIKHNFLGL